MSPPRPVTAMTWAVALGAVGLSLAVLIPTHPNLGIVAAVAILVGGITFYDPTLVPVAAMPTLIVAQRVGGQSVNLSVADAVLFVAFWFALVFARRPFSSELRSLLWLSAVYQAGSLFTVLVNRYPQNGVEWLHAWLLVGGALVVGWAVGVSGRARAGFALYAAACSLVAVGTCVIAVKQLAAGNLSPIYPTWPFAMHKNFAGPLMAWAALVAFANPAWVRWPTWFSMSIFYLCLIGTLGTQSRQALVGLAVGMIIIAFRPGMGRRRAARVMLFSMAPAVVFVATAVQNDLSGENPFNSTADRLVGIDAGMAVWRMDPMFGAGLRWFTAGPLAPGFQPPNAIVETLSSVGVVGLISFVVLVLGAVVVTWRMDRQFGTLALAIVVTRIVQSQFDQFWVSSLVSVPFVLLGICVGAQAFAERTGGSIGDRPTAGESLQRSGSPG